MVLFLQIILGAALTGMQAEHPAFGERVRERERMVEEITTWTPSFPVNDREVIRAMKRVPRHAFIPEEIQSLAYDNRALPIGYEQTISQPFIVAHMTQLLDLGPGNKVLEIGTGSGYQAAVLAEICDSVFSIEIIPQLGERARSILSELDYSQVKIRTGNGYKGWPEEAPFDRMIVTCAPNDIPAALVEQLAPGGRMVIPVGSPLQVQQLVLVQKSRDGKLRTRKQYAVRFVPMTGEH